MFYDRAAALEFAEDFWNRPCKSDNHGAALGLDSARDVPLASLWDQRKAPAASFEPLFVFNPATGRDDLVAMPKPGARAKDGSALAPVPLVDGKKLEDCAHFLSRCLIAGGVAIKEQWSVPMLLIALRESEDARALPIAKTLAEKVPRAAAQRVIDAGLLHIGDMIGYFADGGFQHSAMFTGVRDGVGRVTCHTKSRFMGQTPAGVSDAWHLDNAAFSFTLMHIPYRHPPARGDKMAGWWKVSSPLGTDYCYVRADGRAIRSAKEPASAKPPVAPAAGDTRGYWFEAGEAVKFCWRADGRVVTLTPNAGAATAKVAVDGAGGGTATKL